MTSVVGMHQTALHFKLSLLCPADEMPLIIIIIMDLYSAFRYEDTEERVPHQYILVM